MLNFAVVVYLAATLGSPGEIHRCVDSDGSVIFQDRACAQGQQSSQLAATHDGLQPDAQALRAWLDSLRQPDLERGTTRPAPMPPTPLARASIAPGGSESLTHYAPVSQYALAICSEQFLQCADADVGRMDACVRAMPRCAEGRSAGCCPPACIERYRLERRSGRPLPDAVRLALLDPKAPRCASPPSG